MQPVRRRRGELRVALRAHRRQRLLEAVALGAQRGEAALVLRALALGAAALGDVGPRASGVSFAALGVPYLEHLHGLLQLEPTIRLVVHRRTNHVKHALSFLRTHCHGQVNHLWSAPLPTDSSNASRRAKSSSSSDGSGAISLRVPSALLLPTLETAIL